MQNLRKIRPLGKKWEQKLKKTFNVNWQQDNVVAGKNRPYGGSTLPKKVLVEYKMFWPERSRN